jgi:hypothetical protein
MSSRPRYWEGQLLRAADLVAEQRYRLEMRRRHDIGPHRWGIVDGLDLVVVPEGFVVRPGLAVDGYGRSLVLSEARLVEWTRDLGCGREGDMFEQLNAAAPDGAGIGVWITYTRHRSPACAPATGEAPGRCIERPDLELLPLAGTPMPRQPPGVPEEHVAFPPHESPPDDPEAAWPVYLGRVSRQASAPTYRRDPRHRPLAGLVGESVADPTQRVRMEVGPSGVAKRSRFAVTVAEPTRAAVDRIVLAEQGGITLDRSLAVGPMRPAAAGASDLVLAGGDGTRIGMRLAARPAPEAPAPWEIYHATIDAPAPVGAGTPPPPDHELRFEIEHPGDRAQPSGSRFVVACGPAPSLTQQPPAGLTVQADCTVIAANLDVEGQVVQGPIAPGLEEQLAGGSVSQEFFEQLEQSAAAARAASKLAVQLVLPASPADPGAPCTVTVRNTGSATIRHIAVDSVVTVLDASGGGTPVPARLATEVQLDPGGSFSANVAGVPNARGKDVQVGVTALGLGPALNPVVASDSGKVRVEP